MNDLLRISAGIGMIMLYVIFVYLNMKALKEELRENPKEGAINCCAASTIICILEIVGLVVIFFAGALFQVGVS